MTARLLVIALDGADARQLDRHAADGRLPHLAALRRRGIAQPLTSPPGATDDALWASFQYAVERGEHGRYHYRLPLAGGSFGDAYRAESGRAAFWDALSDAGFRVAVLDVPKCREPRPLNGIHLADWSVHGRYFAAPRSWPPALADAVVRSFGAMPPSRCDYVQAALGDGDAAGIVANLRTGIAQKRAAARHYLAAEPWDLFVVAFKEAHCASHAFWSGDGATLGDPTLAVLRDLDAAIGELVAAAGPDTDVVVFATTGYEANGSLGHLMPGIVARLNAPRALGWRRLLPAWRTAILPYNENWTALRLGRSAAATLGLSPDRPDPAALAATEAALLGLRDADTGQAVVAEVARPSSEEAGACAGQLPDLLVKCASGVFPRAVVSPALGRIAADSPAMRPGNHAGGGFVIAAGEHARAALAGVRTMADFGACFAAVLAHPAAAPDTDRAAPVESVISY